MLEDAKAEFRLTEQRMNKAEEVKTDAQAGEEAIQHSYRILQTNAKCLANEEVNLTVFEQPFDQISKEVIEKYCQIDDDRLRDSIMRYIENSDP